MAIILRLSHFAVARRQGGNAVAIHKAPVHARSEQWRVEYMADRQCLLCQRPKAGTFSA